MVKKQIDIDSYSRMKGGKIENVSPHSKMVNIKPDLSKEQKEKIEKGKTKPLITISDMSDEDLSKLNISELEKLQMRTLRMTSLYINVPVEYTSNVDLTEKHIEFYETNSKDLVNVLRNMIADNIKIEDITNYVNNGKLFFDAQMSENELKDLFIRTNLIIK